MPLSFRHYLFPEDGSLRRIPQRIADALPFGRDAIPEFAGTRQRVAQVILELEDAKPLRILDARGLYWAFDADGRTDEDMWQRMADRADLLGMPDKPNRHGRVVDLVPELKRRELDARDRWTLTTDDLDRIAADLWPGINGPAPEVTTVKGKAPRKPPLTSEGKWALDDIAKHVNAITGCLGGLSERALKGLVFEAMRTSTFQEEALYRGVAEEAKRQEAIRAAHRTGRGEWYAVVEVARALRDYPHAFEQIAVAHEKCASRDKAVEACRRLMADKASMMSADIEITVDVRSALEWRPEGWE